MFQAKARQRQKSGHGAVEGAVRDGETRSVLAIKMVQGRSQGELFEGVCNDLNNEKG